MAVNYEAKSFMEQAPVSSQVEQDWILHTKKICCYLYVMKQLNS